MDVTNLKKMLGFSNTSNHDDYFAEMLPIVIEFAKDKCNNSFFKNGEEVLPGGVKLFVKNAIQFNMNQTGLKSRQMGEVSYTYDTDFPPSIMKYLSPYKKVRFK